MSYAPASASLAPASVPLPPAFMALSSALTGFSQFELYGTGVGEIYYAALLDMLGPVVVQEWLALYERIAQQATATATSPDEQLRVQILGNAAYGPLARNLIRMWYTGSWVELPASDNWTLGPVRNNQTRVLTAQTYLEGLAWKAIHAHPMGGKQLGFGSWALPPAGLSGTDLRA